MSGNGCDDNGYDLYEKEVKELFERFAHSYYYFDLTLDSSGLHYKSVVTNDVWKLFHLAHVKGRLFWGDKK